jgi:hypothetical protein
VDREQLPEEELRRKELGSAERRRQSSLGVEPRDMWEKG